MSNIESNLGGYGLFKYENNNFTSNSDTKSSKTYSLNVLTLDYIYFNENTGTKIILILKILKFTQYLIYFLIFCAPRGVNVLMKKIKTR